MNANGSLNQRILAVIWDMGGVLLRTEDPQPREGLARRLGLSRWELESLVFGGDSGTAAQLGVVTAELHYQAVCRVLHLEPEETPSFLEAFYGGDAIDSVLVDFTRSLRPRYKIGLLSNAFSDGRDYLTDHWHIADAFDDLVFSAEEGVKKPDPRIYKISLERLGVQASQAVFIDDFSENIVGAEAVGMHAIHFRSQDQALAELSALLDAD